MSFSTTAKEELIRLPFGKSCCLLAELSALTATSASLGLQGWQRFSVTYEVENHALARRLFRLLKNGMGFTPSLQFVQHARFGGRRTCVLTVPETEAPRLLTLLGMAEETDGAFSLKRRNPSVRLSRQCCRRAYLRGCFLGAGAMANPDRAYHLEWVCGDGEQAKQVSRCLKAEGLHPSAYDRRGSRVLYLNHAQDVADALALLGASAAVMKMENIRATRQLRGQATRAANCDEHNSERMLTAAQTQKEAILRLSIEPGLHALPPALEELARLRLEHDELSLAELGQLMTPPVGKSGVNHRMRRLMEMAEKAEESHESSADAARRVPGD